MERPKSYKVCIGYSDILFARMVGGHDAFSVDLGSKSRIFAGKKPAAFAFAVEWTAAGAFADVQ